MSKLTHHQIPIIFPLPLHPSNENRERRGPICPAIKASSSPGTDTFRMRSSIILLIALFGVAHAFWPFVSLSSCLNTVSREAFSAATTNQRHPPTDLTLLHRPLTKTAETLLLLRHLLPQTVKTGAPTVATHRLLHLRHQLRAAKALRLRPRTANLKKRSARLLFHHFYL